MPENNNFMRNLSEGSEIEILRFEVTRQPEILIHNDRESPFKNTRFGMLCHQLRLRIILRFVGSLHPVINRLHMRHTWDAKFTTWMEQY